MDSLLVCKNENEMVELANKIAPEHLELMVGERQISFKKDYRCRFTAHRKKHTIMLQAITFCIPTTYFQPMDLEEREADCRF